MSSEEAGARRNPDTNARVKPRTPRPPLLCQNRECRHPRDAHWAWEGECIWGGCECKKFVSPST